MRFTPRERDRMMIAVAAMVAKDRLARGVRLNHPESVAIVTNFILEGARDGRTVAELTSSACKVLTRDHVMEGVDSMIEEIQVDATFPDGVKLVSVHNPVR